MKPLSSPLLLALGAAFLLGLASPALAVPFDNNPKILLHVRTPTKNPCLGTVLSNCQNAVTEWNTDAVYAFVHVLAARGSLPGLGAAQFGIQYQNACPSDIADAQGLDIYAWQSCATLEFPSTGWPGPGEGNRVQWDVSTRCQVGEFGVVGYFYVGAYGPDVLQVVARPLDGLAKVADCSSVETILPVSALGMIRFSAGASLPGCNPCDGPCVPAGPTTCAAPSDTIAPSAVTNLTFLSSTDSTITISWNAPADNPGGSGLDSYIGRISTSPITNANFDAASPISMPPPTTPGRRQSGLIGGLDPRTTYYIALKTRDHAGNVSAISNVTQGTTQEAPGPDLLAPTKLLIHLGPAVGNPELRCAGGQIPDCEQAVTAGGLLPARYYAYLLAGNFGELAGFTCGITYDNGQPSDQLDHNGLDILSWTLCAVLEFPTASPAPWPAPGSGNLVTWDHQNGCQTGPVAIAGYFYVSAYEPDVLSITRRPVDSRNSVANCQAMEVDLPLSALGSARFSAAGNLPGVNPCGDAPIGVEPTTWSRVKVLAMPAGHGGS